MLRHHIALHHYVIYIDLNILAQLGFKHLGHHPLIGGSHIFQAKGHHLVMVVSSGGNKGCLLLII